MPAFPIRCGTQFRVYERADLTALGRPLKQDKQIRPPFITRLDIQRLQYKKCNPKIAPSARVKFYEISPRDKKLFTFTQGYALSGNEIQRDAIITIAQASWLWTVFENMPLMSAAA